MASERTSAIWSVIRVSSGNFLEMYDFMIFGYYASAIGSAFFPGGNSFVSLMLSLMTFGAGFLMRPLGAIVLGAYADRHGRRAGLLLTLSLMSLGIVSIACTPSYATIGLLAPLLVLTGRLLQGFSAGMELSGVSVYLSEIATPGRKGFFVSWQSGSQQVAVIFAALIGVVLNSALPPEEMMRWGWRVPLLVGCAIVPFLFRLRRSLKETDGFIARKRRPRTSEILRSLSANWRIVLIGALLVTMTTVSFYLITAYTPTFGNLELHLATMDSLIVTLCVGASNLFWLPVMGALSDRIGRRPLLLACTILMLVTAYPVMLWLVHSPSFSKLLAAELWLSFIYGSYTGAMVVYLTEIMPVEVRISTFALAYSLATAVFGGFTPAISTYLIHVTQNRAVPGLWLSFAAACGLGATLSIKPQSDLAGLARNALASGQAGVCSEMESSPKQAFCRSSNNIRYGGGALAFHWTMAVLIMVVGVLGLLHDFWPRQTQASWINIHAMIGLIVWALGVARIIWRLRHAPPDLPPHIGEFSRRVSYGVHLLLYFLILIIPIFGIVTFIWHGRVFEFGFFSMDFGIRSNREIFHPTEDIHGYLAYALFALAGIHVLAALWHQFIRRDGLLLRMWPS